MSCCAHYRPGLLRLAVLPGLLFAGCSGGSSGGPAPSGPDGQVTVRVIDENQFADELRQHRGKVVLVDFWASWCLPCKKLFPHAVELHKRFAGRGLVVISVNLDDPQSESATLEFLAKQQATFDNFISRHGAGPKSAQLFDIDDGALPHLRLYDRRGRLRHKFAESATPPVADRIDQAVEELLDET